MKATSKYNKSEIMKEAHNLYKANKRFGWNFSKSLASAWNNTKLRLKAIEVEAKNEAIRAMWKAQHEAKIKAETEVENNTLQESGMNLHTYRMTNYYANNRYNGD